MTIESTHKVIYTITPEYGGAYGWIIRNGDESQGLGPNHASSLFGWGGGSSDLGRSSNII